MVVIPLAGLKKISIILFKQVIYSLPILSNRPAIIAVLLILFRFVLIYSGFNQCSCVPVVNSQSSDLLLILIHFVLLYSGLNHCNFVPVGIS